MNRAGKYREHIDIIRKTRVDLPSGDYTMEDVLLLETFAHVSIRNAGVDTVVQHRDIEQLFIFSLRFRTDVEFESGDIIVWRDRRFVIQSFTWDIMRTELIIRAFTENESTGV